MNPQSILPNRKVLIADDDPDCRLLLAMLLSEEGWEVIEAKNGQEALEKVKQQAPNVLILDNRMPKITGVEVCQSLQSEQVKIGIILVSAYSDIKSVASSLGINYVLTKPFNFSELFELVDLAYQEVR